MAPARSFLSALIYLKVLTCAFKIQEHFIARAAEINHRLQITFKEVGKVSRRTSSCDTQTDRHINLPEIRRIQAFQVLPPAILPEKEARSIKALILKASAVDRERWSGGKKEDNTQLSWMYLYY